MAFLARLVGALAPSAVEGTSRDVGERGRVFVEGVSDEVERLLVDCFGPGSDRLEVDGSDSGMREGGDRGSRGWREDRKKGSAKMYDARNRRPHGEPGSIRESKRLTWALPPQCQTDSDRIVSQWQLWFHDNLARLVFPQTFPVSSCFPSLWLHLSLPLTLYQSISTGHHTRPRSRPAYSTNILPPVQILSLVDTMNWQRGRFRHDDLYASAPRFSMNNWDYSKSHRPLGPQRQCATSLISKLVKIVQVWALGSSLPLLSGFHPDLVGSPPRSRSPQSLGRVRSERVGGAERHNRDYLSNDFCVKVKTAILCAVHPCKSFSDQIRTHFRTGMIF